MQNKRLLEYVLVVAAVLVVIAALYYGQAQLPVKVTHNVSSTTTQTTINITVVSTLPTTTLLENVSTSSSTSTTTIPNNSSTGKKNSTSNSTSTNITLSAKPLCTCLNEPQLQAIVNDSYAEGLNSTYNLSMMKEGYNGGQFGFNITEWNAEYSSGTYTEQNEALSYTVIQNNPVANATYLVTVNRTGVAYAHAGAFTRMNGTVNGLTYTMYNSITQSGSGILRSAYFIGYMNRTYVILSFSTQNSGVYSAAEIANAIASVI